MKDYYTGRDPIHGFIVDEVAKLREQEELFAYKKKKESEFDHFTQYTLLGMCVLLIACVVLPDNIASLGKLVFNLILVFFHILVNLSKFVGFFLNIFVYALESIDSILTIY